ncbi:hypothetical protein BKG94_06295 [Rodentibacter ratti]|uniref:hypothetical protein n=1 Tax=Rodentibacter ratti TaxID=1906745 RepID=UPI0009863C0D|nr:hypothetical protein [Rodentibacter ratti]OOF88749.1 hypothetical protein BKG94_06295 [Rodentibacter ratti]
MNEISIVIAIISVIAILILWNSGRKVRRTFYQAIENAQDYIIYTKPSPLDEYYTLPGSSRKTEVELLGIDFVLKTESQEEIRKAVKITMAYFIAGAVLEVYKHMSEKDVFRMLNYNTKIKEKFEEAVSVASMFARGGI